MPLHDLSLTACFHCGESLDFGRDVFICYEPATQQYRWFCYTLTKNCLNEDIGESSVDDHDHFNRCLAGYNPRDGANNPTFWTRRNLWDQDLSPHAFGRDLTEEEFFALPSTTPPQTLP